MHLKLNICIIALTYLHFSLAYVFLVHFATDIEILQCSEFYIFLCFQVIANALLLICANLIGCYYQFMSWQSQKETFEKTRSTVESRVKLECEKEHQEQLLLSVIPAYIAAEVS